MFLEAIGKARKRGRARWLAVAVAAGGLGFAVPPAAAQGPYPRWGEVFAGGELEEYLRYQQALGHAELYPWSIRALSPREVARIAPDSAHLWSGRYRFSPDPARRVNVDAHAVSVRTVFNSSFPYGINDGPVWAGRGVTASLQGGASVTVGPVTATLAPLVFWSQNSEFELRPNGTRGSEPFADPLRAFQIDLPQRFGEGAYARIDPGQSSIRADRFGITAGVSTASQYWGPASTLPLILGNNAPGFLHAFAGTSSPWDLWAARVHGRLYWGRIEQSGYAGIPADSAARFMAGIVGSLTPRGVPGLEIGGARFFHTPWPAGGPGLAGFVKPFETFAKIDIDRSGSEVFDAIAANQLASLFFRWVLPRSGFESYGEFAREDNSHNLRDFLAEPDHNSAYMLGFRKAWPTRESGFLALRGEVLNATRSHLFQRRRQEPFYVHSVTRQGHTSVGQILGSPAAYDGAGSILAVERYGARGKVTASWSRTFRQGEVQTPAVEPTAADDRSDVTHVVGVDALLFRDRLEWSAGVAGVYERNRYQGPGAFGVNGTLGVRAFF